jgi:hypothetical protein
MKRTSLKLTLTLVAMTASSAFGMHYYVNPNASPILTIPVPSIHPQNNVSSCTSASNTVAVGYEIYDGGFRILCADAGRIGFWTNPVGSALVGQQLGDTERFVCPSGSALAGAQYIEGLLYPFPLCGELIPDMKTGYVSRTVLFSVNHVVVEKLSKTPPTTPGVIAFGPGGYVQSLQAFRKPDGTLAGFSMASNAIVTDPANLEDVNVDLAVKTVGQTYLQSRNANAPFRVDIYNLGISAIPGSNVSLEIRFDATGWQLPAGYGCSDILARKGFDRVVVGARCPVPNTIDGRGGLVQIYLELQPLGPASSRPASPTPQPIVGAKVGVVDEQLEGADPDTANDEARFPVVLQ